MPEVPGDAGIEIGAPVAPKQTVVVSDNFELQCS